MQELHLLGAFCRVKALRFKVIHQPRDDHLCLRGLPAAHVAGNIIGRQTEPRDVLRRAQEMVLESSASR